ncbi:MAG: hypothetical protein HY308_15585 [Gammaproteobacteria bacterium]|nr:hypothetical protein [Gammaproteobacteria bacterium]
MNALFLLLAVAVTFAFGYRFYAKLLTLEIFRLEENYSTPAQALADAYDFVPVHSHLLLGHHIAAVTGVTAFVGPLVAASWGWVPAFLWLTIGSTVAAGTYALGGFWLAVRRPHGIGRTAAELISDHVRLPLLLLALVILFILVAACAGLVASVLATFPTAALPFWAIVLLALGVGHYLHGRRESALLPTTLIAIVLALLLIGALSRLPFTFAGTLNVTLGQTTLLSIDAVLVWVVLLMVYAFHAARLPIWKLMRPRGFFSASLLVIALLIFYVALGWQHPTLTAPQFQHADTQPSTLPWLFILLSSGALAGVQLLIIYGVTGRQLRRETDAHYVGYGAALIEGLIALSALIVVAVAFADSGEWAKHAASLSSPADFPRALAFYVEQYARLVATLGIDATLARCFIATVLASLALAALEAAVRALRVIFAELIPATSNPIPTRNNSPTRLWWIIGLAGLLALADGHGLGGLSAWPLLALASLWLAAFGFALIALGLRAAERSYTLLTALALMVAALAAWSTIAQLLAWAQTNAWGWFAAAVVILLFAAVIGIHTIRAWFGGQTTSSA